MHGLNIIENSEVPAQTPPWKGGVRAGTALFSEAYIGEFNSESIKLVSRHVIYDVKSVIAAVNVARNCLAMIT